MITIYHLDNSRSERMVWLAEELDLPYQLQTFLREANQLAPQAFRDIHPLGRAPVVRDGDILMMESGAIVDYLIRRYGNGRLQPPADSADYARYLQWLHFAEGTAMSNLLLEYIGAMLTGTAAQESGPMAMFQARNATLLQFLDDELGRAPYFAGSDFSGADIMMEFVFSFLQRWRGDTLSGNTAAWLERVRSRPAYAKAMTVAGPKS